MNVRFLTSGFALLVGTCVALSQFVQPFGDPPANPPEFELTAGFHILPNGDNQIQFFARNLTESDLKVDGSFFYIVIGDGSGSPAPSFVLDSWDGVTGTPFEGRVTENGYEFSSDLRALSWHVDTDNFDPNYWATFRTGVNELLMTVTVNVKGIPDGTWPLQWLDSGSTGLGGGPFTIGSSYNLILTDGELTVVPEPSQFALVGGLALLGFAGWRRSRS